MNEFLANVWPNNEHKTKQTKAKKTKQKKKRQNTFLASHI